MTFENTEWFVNPDKVRTDYPVIENISQFYAPTPPQLPKYHPQYIKYWSKEFQKCIEGIWRKEFGQWRYMTGSMYFYINFGVIQHTIKEAGVDKTKFMKPIAADYVWENRYYSWCAYGFSGFEKDTEFNCHRKLEDFYKDQCSLEDLPEECLHNGQPKKFVDPFEYIKGLHKHKLGKSLFGNTPLNKDTMGSRGGGKALLHGSIVYTEDGTKLIEDVVVRDKIFGADGKLTNVTAVYPQGIVPIYKIKFRSGRGVECCENHLWKVVHRNSYIESIKSTKDLVKDYYIERKDGKTVNFKYKVPINGCLDYSTKDFKIDPYLIGCLLGDGHISNKHANKVINITTSGKDLQHYLDTIILPKDCKFRVHQKGNTDNYTIFIGHNSSDAINLLKLNSHIYNEFERLAMAGKIANNKFIPEEYFYGDEKQRLRLLQGLIDTDGHVSAHKNANCTSYNYVSVSEQLTKDIVRLSRSLGYNAKYKKTTSKIENKQDKYIVTIFSDSDTLCSLPRKKEKVKSRTVKSNSNILQYDLIVDITKQKDGEATCITVDNEDRLFLTNDFVVTHNSYEVAIAELEYNYIFSGSRRFDEDFVNNTLSCFQVIGAADTSKSADCLAKFKKSQDAKLDASNADFKKWFGIIEEFDSEGNSTITPCPFYKRSLGTLECPNKRKPYTSRYKAEINGEWKERGVDNRIYHVNYSTKKGDGAQAAVGERYLYSDVEEQGLVENLVEIHGSNEPATKRGAKVGIQDFQGTSGNIEYVQSAKKVWLNPRDYFIYPLRNKFTTDGANGEAGVFLPRYMLNFEFKDANGNTDYKKAIDSVNKERIEAAKSKDPSVLRNLLINEPCYPHEMWMHTSGYYLPYEEAAERERELMKEQVFKQLGTPVIFKWDEKVTKGVSYDVAHNVEPIYDFPIPKELKDPSGCAVIYEQPIDNPPKDFYIYCCDPYVEEDIDKGGSLAVTYVIKNPKYVALGHVGHFIVASYIGKPSKGLSYYYEQQEKLIQYYGNFPQSFWYDARGGGETLRDFYIRKGKQYILCLRPNHTKGDSMYEKHTTTHGVVIGNRDSKKTVLKLANDKLLETNLVVEDGVEKVRRNIFRIPCIFLIRQIMQYNLDDNFDAVSAFYIGILGLNEMEAKVEKAQKNARKINIFEGLLNNDRIFKQDGWKNRYNDYEEIDTKKYDKDLVPSQF